MAAVKEIRRECGLSPKKLNGIVSKPMRVCKVAVVDDAVVGFMAYRSGDKGKKLIEIVVRPSSRRMGVATSLLETLSQGGFSKPIEALVQESDFASQMMLKKAGFRAVDIIGRSEDAKYKFVMEIPKNDEKGAADGKCGLHRPSLS